jgi:putative glycosyltransferase (TIGR04372 family)
MRNNKLQKPITRLTNTQIIIKCLIGIWFVILLLIIRPFVVIYLAPLASGRIGHFVLDTEILLARLLEINKGGRKAHIIWVPNSTIINSCVYEIWRKRLRIVRYSIVADAVLSTATYFEKFTRGNITMTLRFEGWDGFLPYVNLLNKYPPIFQMSDADKIECESTLSNIGIDTNKEWVCILNRDSLYLNKIYPKADWGFNDFRNSKIDTYLESAEFLAQAGLYVFRMGRVVEEELRSTKSSLVVDYANSDWKSDKMDVYLSSYCKFFLSSSTGLDAIAYALRKPLVTVNLAQPLSAIYTKPNHIFIYKKFLLNNSYICPSRYYNLGIEKNAFTIDNKNFLRSQDLSRLQIRVVDNTSAEILDATKEMFFLLKSSDDFSSLNFEQIEFWRNFPTAAIQSQGKPLSRVGAKFICENPWLKGSY